MKRPKVSGSNWSIDAGEEGGSRVRIDREAGCQIESVEIDSWLSIRRRKGAWKVVVGDLKIDVVLANNGHGLVTVTHAPHGKEPTKVHEHVMQDPWWGLDTLAALDRWVESIPEEDREAMVKAYEANRAEEEETTK